MKAKKPGAANSSGNRVPYDPLRPEPNPEYDSFYSEISSARAYEGPPESFDEYTVVRKADIKKAGRPTATALLHPEYEYLRLAGSSEKKRMRSFLVTLQGPGETKRFVSHRGEEFILVHKGAIRIVLDDREEVLHEGDSIYYRSIIPHRIENLSKGRSIILAVLYGA